MSQGNAVVFCEHEGMILRCVESEKGLIQYCLNTERDIAERVDGIPTPMVQLAIAGRPHGAMSAMVSGLSALPGEMTLTGFEDSEEAVRFHYGHKDTGLVVEVTLEKMAGAAVLRSHTRVRNEGSEPVVLNHLSSLCVQGIASDGLLPWHDPRKIRVHYCVQTWEGEGQWRSGDLESLGVYPASVHPETGTFHLASVGSFSTARFLPMVVVEDCETGKVWYVQIETSSSWHIEVAHRGSWTDDRGALFLHADGADERHLGWAHELKPGEVFDAPPAAVGCCRGGFQEAIHELTRYRRLHRKPPPAWSGECPVIFNDYMNCLWGNPTRERLEPLVAAAAQAGAEVFCIDAGWFGGREESWGSNLGIWEPSTDRFGEGGLQGMLDDIRAQGMVPGLWLEMEVCGEQTPIARNSDEWFLRRHGQRVNGGPRLFLNFAHPPVCDYMHGVIDRLVDMGVGFIKNDYNECVGLGDDTLGTTAADGLLTHSRAFYSFIDEVRARHPKLIIENCGSGAMREDYGILSHFHIQSSTDQEIHRLMPAVIAGSLAGVLPEQLGIWSYPYPHLFFERDSADVLDSPDYQARMADGEETIFNLVNGLCGNVFLSGRIDKADARNQALIREGIAIYKQERSHIHHAHPVWPLGLPRINHCNAWTAVGLANDENSRILLAVWRLDSGEPTMTMPIPGWAGSPATVRQRYPESGYAVPIAYQWQTGMLTVEFPKSNMARYFELRRA